MYPFGSLGTVAQPFNQELKSVTIRFASADDAGAWDRFVETHPRATPYHRFAWRKSVENAYGHDCFYLIAEDKRGQISGVLPTAKIKPLFLSGKLCALPYCDVGEVLASDNTTAKALIENSIRIADDHGLSGIEHRASASPITEFDEQRYDGHKTRMLLDLPNSSELLMQSFKSKHRSQIRKAIKNGLTIRLGRDADLIEHFYRVFSRNMHMLGSPVHSKQWFRQIHQNYSDNMVISTVWLEGTVVGAGIILLNGNLASIPWASTVQQYNRLAPNMLLYWSLLEYASDNGFSTFDFGRSSVGEGTYKFKQQWGAQPLPLDWQNFDSQGHARNDTSVASGGKGRLRLLAETIWRQLPHGASVLIGPRIRKYISL